MPTEHFLCVFTRRYSDRNQLGAKNKTSHETTGT